MGKILNVGLIIYGHLEIVTGGFIYDRRLVEFLRSQGDRVEIFAFPWRTYPFHLLQNFSRTVLKWARSCHLDILLEDELNHPSLFMLNKRLRKAAGCPIISIVHHLRSRELRPSWHNAIYEEIENFFLGTVDGFVFPSRTTEASVRSLVTGDKPFVVANPGKDSIRGVASPDDVVCRSRESGPLRILFVGNLIPRKGLHTLLDAVAKLPADKWALNVVGNENIDVSYSGSVHNQVRRLRLQGNVDFLGTVTGDKLSHLYRSSHILAVPSSYEGFGMVYVEGMAFGLPAIASTLGAAHEIVQDGINGFLVDPDDRDTLMARIVTLMSDRNRLAEMGLMALKRYDGHPSWSETGEQIRSLLVQMVDPRGPARHSK